MSISVTTIIIWSQGTNAGDWRVTLLYSDGTWKDYQLSFPNVQSYINSGAKVIDQTNGLFTSGAISSVRSDIAMDTSATATLGTPPPGHNVSIGVSDDAGITDR